MRSASFACRAATRRWRVFNETPRTKKICHLSSISPEHGQQLLQHRRHLTNSLAVASSSAHSFHGLDFPQEKSDAQDRRGVEVQEAEVVTSEQDNAQTRELIKEAVRAEMSAHSSVPTGDTLAGDNATDSAKGKEMGPYERKLQRMGEAKRHHEKIDKRSQALEYAQSCIEMGELYYQLGDMDRCQELFVENLQDLLNGNDTESIRVQMMIAQSMHALGAVHARCGEYDEASRWYEESLKRKREMMESGSDSQDDDVSGRGESASIFHRYELGRTYNGLAVLEVMRGGNGRYERAMSLFREAEHYYHPTSEKMERRDPCLQATDASLSLTKADIQKMTPQHVESIINVWSNMGELSRQHAKYEEAGKCFQLSLDAARMALENTHEQGSATNQIDVKEQGSVIVDLLVKVADNLISANKHDEAAEAYEQALHSHVFFRKCRNGGKSTQQGKIHQAATSALQPITTSAPKIKFNLSTATTIEAAIRNNLAHALAQIGNSRIQHTECYSVCFIGSAHAIDYGRAFYVCVN